MKYKIYQVDPHDCDYAFEWWSWAKNRFNFKRDYKEVYSGDVVPDEYGPTHTLEDLFQTFNINHPADFKGHSLSVSDVVELDGRYWYCDSVGWLDITKFINVDLVEPESDLSGGYPEKRKPHPIAKGSIPKDTEDEPSLEDKADDILAAWNM